MPVVTFAIFFRSLPRPGVGNYVHTKGRICKISKNFEAEGRKSADVQFYTQVQVKSKKRVITSADVLFFTENQRGTVKNRLWLDSR